MLFSVCGCDARGEHGCDTRGNMVVVQGGNIVVVQGGTLPRARKEAINENENHLAFKRSTS